jgi:predicted TIM-barrel fold metal-dependent hydrolase
MRVVDVDTHWESTAAGSNPLKAWNQLLPKDLDRLAFAIAGDLLRALPPERRPDAATLLPGLVAAAEARGGPVILHPQHDSSTAERVAWMDLIGIDHCLVNPGGYWQGLEFLGADRARGAARCNDYLAEQLADHADRLHGVAVVDLTDPAGAAHELERARARGHRAFFLYTVNGRPPGNVSPGHPSWDPVWSAAVHLGMVAVIHVGNTAADFDGWADVGWDEPGGAGIAGLVRLANTQRTHVGENVLTALLYGGVFARHPALTVVLEEMRVGWLPFFVHNTERQCRSSFALGEWPWETSGGDMLRRNVRFTPLPGFGDTDALDVLHALPEMCVFSSDFPHMEGNADPIALYGDALDALDGDLRTSFLGQNMLECFARTGDPLPDLSREAAPG